MKNKFQSKAVPRGTRTIWRYLSALILFFALGIGQMWGADPTIGSGELPSSTLDISSVSTTRGTGKVISSGSTTSGNPYYVMAIDSIRQNYKSKATDIPWVYCKATDGGGSHTLSLADGLSDADKLGFLTTVASAAGINSGRYHNYRIKNCTSVTVLNRSNNTKDEKRIWLNIFKYNSLTKSFEYQEQIKSAYNSSKDIVVSATLSADDEYVIQITSGATSNSKCSQIRFTGVAATSYTVTLNPNEGGYATTPTGWTVSAGNYTKTVSAGALTIPEPTRASYDFAGWKSGLTDITLTDGKLTVAKDTTLVAQWVSEKQTPEVTFNDGAYVVGASALDLSGLFTSQNTSAVTFALKVASEDATVSGSNFTATKEGSYVIVATQPADANYKAVSKEATMVVTYPAMGSATIIYNVAVGTSQTSLATASKEDNSASISNLVGFTAVEIATRSGGGKTASSPKLETPSTKAQGKYVYVTFDVAGGKEFVLDSVVTKMVAVSNSKTFEIVVSDTEGTKDSLNYEQGSNSDPGTAHQFNFTSSAKAYQGTVTIKIYAYGSSANDYRIGKPLKVCGKVQNIPTPSAPSISAPDADQAAVYDLNDEIAALSITASGYPTPTYQWYSNSSASTEGATAIEGAQSASYTPANNVASDSYYYCVATNSQGSATSHYFHVTVNAPAVPTIYTETTALTLTSNKVATGSETFTFSGANLGETAVTLVLASAVDGLTLSESSVTPTTGAITDKEITVSYKSLLDVAEADVNLYLKQGDDILKTIVLTYSSTAGIEALTSISAATTWDWKDAADAAFGTLGQNDMIVLANADVTWDAGFNALAIAGKLQHYYRDSKYAQGHELKFNTTIPGRVTVTFSNTGSKDVARAPRITDVNGSYAPTAEEDGSKNTTAKTYTHNVAAGDVLIAGFEMQTGTPANMLRFYKVEFVPTYTVAYAANGGSGDMTDANAYVAGDEVTLLANTFTPATGFVWSGWTVKDANNDDVAVSEGKFTMPASNVTVTAQWADASYVAQIGETKYATLEAALEHAAEGTIVLARNINTEAQIEIAAGVTATIDLAGYKIEYTGASTLASGVILVHNGASLTINDSSDPDAGSIVSGANAYAAIALTKAGDDAANKAILVINGGTFTGDYYAITGNGSRHNTEITINAGTFSGAHSEDNSAIYHPQQGTLTINNGTFTGYSAAIELRAGTLEINDGTFTATATEYSCNPSGSGTTTVGAAIAIAQHNTQKDIAVTINGGTFEGVKAINEANPQGNPAPAVAMSVTDGDFTGEVSTVDVDNFVSAGSFSEEVPVEYCADGYIPAPQDPVTNKYTVKEGWKVTFVDGDDEEIVPVDKDATVAEKAMSDKAGYIFDGWFNGVDLYDFAANVTSDLTLNAQWTAFVGCADLWPATSGEALSAGDEVDLQTGSFGGTIVASTDNISYGEYGLLLKSSGSTYVTVTLNNDMVENTKITVVLAAGGTSERGVNLRAAVGSTNVQQMKWTPAAIGEEKTFEYTLDSESALKDKNIFYLYRNGNVYIKSIRVESCGDAIIYHNLTSAVVPAGKGTVTLGAGTVRENHTTTATYSGIDPLYEFVSWSVSGEGASVENATANPATITIGTEDAVVTLNLQLIPVKFTVNYYDGTTLKGTELVVVNENPTASEINTNKRHFTFQGWSDTDGGSVVALNTITRTEATTVNLYAVYAPVVCPTEGTVFSMEFDNTKAPTETVVAPKNGGVVELADYATISGGDARIINNNSSNKDAISTDGKFLLKASDEVMKIELDCAIAAGDVIRIPDNNAKYVLSTSNAKTGTYQERTSSQHEFEATAAWNGVDDLYVLYDGSSLNFTKVYVLRPYTVSFDLQGHGDAIDAQKLVEGKKVAEPTAPTAEGWDFKGWYKEAACTNAWDFDNDVVEGATAIYAKWTEHVTNDATLKSLKYGTTDITLVDGLYSYDVELAASVAAVPVLSAETNAELATKLITDASAFEAGQATSTVLVTAEDGVTQLTYTVNFTKAAALPQVNVTEATVWDFTTSVAGSTSMENLTDVVLANVPGITNDATFNSQALKGTFNKMPGNYFQGSKLSFTTEVDGMLRVIFRGTNNNSRHLQVCVGEGEDVIADWDYKGSGEGAEKDSAIYVPAGKVTLKAFEGNSANNARIYRMELITADNYHRTVNPSYLGTLCWKNNAVLGGATLYEFAGKNEYNYLVFDEVEENRLEAGKPYIFMPENGNTLIKVFNTDNEAALTEDQDPVNNMYGTITGKTLVPGVDDNMYYFSSNHIWAVKDFAVNIFVPAYYCYVDYAAVLAAEPAPAPAPGRRRVTMGVNGQNVATGMGEIEASETPMKVMIDGQLFIIRGEKMFDATGRLVK